MYSPTNHSTTNILKHLRSYCRIVSKTTICCCHTLNMWLLFRWRHIIGILEFLKTRYTVFASLTYLDSFNMYSLMLLESFDGIQMHVCYKAYMFIYSYICSKAWDRSFYTHWLTVSLLLWFLFIIDWPKLLVVIHFTRTLCWKMTIIMKLGFSFDDGEKGVFSPNQP